MLIVQVHVHVKEDAIDKFLSATVENARESVKEPGIARFDVIQEREDRSRFVLLEIYRSEEDPLKHKLTKHYEVWRDAVEHMMAEPRFSVKYHNKFPDDQGWG